MNMSQIPRVRTIIEKGQAIIVGAKKDEKSECYQQIFCLNTGDNIMIKEIGYISKRAYFLLELRILIAIAIITLGTVLSILSVNL